MKKAIVASTASCFAFIVGMSWAAGSRQSVALPGEKVIGTYEDAVRAAILNQPVDGKFGMSRTPSIHAVYASSVSGYKDIKELSKDYRIYSFLAGSPGTPPKRDKTSSALFGSPPHIIAGKTMNAGCFLRIFDEKDWADPAQGGIFFGRSRFPDDTEAKKAKLKSVARELTSAVEDTYWAVDAKGYNAYSTKTNIDGEPAWISTRLIKPKDKACYNCHSGVKPGQAIGQVITVVIKKDQS